jgi:hypothetical protein
LTIARHLLGCALAALLAGCGEGLPLSGAGEDSELVFMANHDTFPPGVGSWRVTMERQGSNPLCRTALTRFTLCSTALLERVTGLCSGDWQMLPLSTGIYASTDCSGSRLNAQLNQAPSPVTLPFNTSATVVVIAQGSSSLLTDMRFSGSALIPATTESVSIRARHTPNPDPACSTSETDLAEQCFSYTPGTDFPPQDLSPSACSGTWTLCSTGYSSPNCTGAVTERGLLDPATVNFGSVNTLLIDSTAPGPACPF